MWIKSNVENLPSGFFCKTKGFSRVGPTFGAMTLDITTLSGMTFSINDTQHNRTSAIRLRVIRLSVTIYSLLC